MPVEAIRVKGELQKLFPKVNLTTKRIDEISARLAKKAADDADDAAITQLVNDANEYFPFAEIAKDDDRIRTLEAKKQQGKSDDKKGDEGKNPEPPGDDVPNWAKSMIAANEKLLTEIETLKTGNVIKSKREEARKLFEQNTTFKGLSEKAQNHYLDQLKYEDETPIADQVTGLEEIVKDIVQTRADNLDVPGKPPVTGGNPTAISTADMDKILKNVRA